MSLFKKKSEKAQSITIKQPEEAVIIEQEEPELPKQEPIAQKVQEVQVQPQVEIEPQPEAILKDFAIVTESTMLDNGSYRYVVISDRKLYLGLQED